MEKIQQRYTMICAVVCSAVFVFLPLLPGETLSRFWGLGHAGLVPLWFRILMAMACLALALSSVNRWIWDRILPCLQSLESFFRQRSVAAFSLLGFLSCALFWFLRDRNFALGDSEHLIKVITFDVNIKGWHVTFDEALSLLLHSGIYRLFHHFDGGELAELAFAIPSAAGGAIFVIVLLLLCRRLTADTGDRTVLMLLALSGGYVQLLFGHVENYTLVAVCCLVYLYLGVRDLQGHGGSLFLPAAVLSLGVSFHLLAGWLYPTLLYLWWAGRGRRRSLGRGAAAIITGAALPLVITFMLSRWAGYGADHLGQTHLAAMKFIFLLDAEYEHFQYAFLSLRHFGEALNQLWLTALPALLAIGLAVACRRPPAKRPVDGICDEPPVDAAVPDRSLRFLLLSAILFQIFVLSWNPDLGAHKDWDLFAVAGLGYSVLAIGLLASLSRAGVPVRAAGLSLAACGLLFTLPWLTGNHFQTVPVDPGHHLAHLAMGHAHLRAGDARSAMAEYEEASRIRPGSGLVEVCLGDACAAGGSRRDALDHYRAALELGLGEGEASKVKRRIRQIDAERGGLPFSSRGR